MSKPNIALVMGGYSGEHDISILSGCQVYDSLDHQKYNIYKIVVDRQEWYHLTDDGQHIPVNRHNFTIPGVDHFQLAFIIIHGNPGENGVLQGYFDTLGIPYTTSGYYTSALTFHKGYCNPVVKSFGIVSVAPSVLIYDMSQASLDKIAAANLTYPLFVKPAAGGSSVATTKVKEPAYLLPAIEQAFTEDSQVLIEECIKGREFDCGVFRTKTEKYIFPITEIIPLGGHEFFDYQAKYQGFSNEVTPAQCPTAVSKHIQDISSQLYDLLNCRGIVRFDYIYNDEQNQLYFLEVNTIPGQSAESIVPKQARAMGISTSQLYQMIIDTSL